MLLKRLRQLAGESLIYGLSSIIGRFLSVWLTPIYTRLLTPADYGAMSMVGVAVALIQSFATFALDLAAMRWFYDGTNETERRRPFATWFWAHLALASSAAVLLVMFAAPLSVVTTKDESLAPWFRLIAITIPLGVAGSVASTWLRMERRAWTTVSFTTGQVVLQIGLTFLFVVKFGMGLKGIYWAQIIASAASLIASVVLVGRVLRPQLFDRQMLGKMLRYGAPFIPAAIAMWVVGSIDRFFVQRHANTAEVGIFSIGASIASLMTLAVWAFQQAWAPFALSIREEADARSTYASVFLIYCAGGSLAVAGLSLFSPVAIRILATPTYDRASHVVGTLAMSYVLMGVGNIVGIGYAITKASRPSATAVGVGALCTVVMNALLVPRYGMVGSAVATVIGQGAQPIFLLVRSRTVYPIDFPVLQGTSMLAWAMVLVVVGETLLPTSISFSGVFLRFSLLLTVPVAAALLGIIKPAQLGRLLARQVAG